MEKSHCNKLLCILCKYRSVLSGVIPIVDETIIFKTTHISSFYCICYNDKFETMKK